MKEHKYWSLGALAAMFGIFYAGYKNMKSAHKYFACSSLFCMIIAIYSGHEMISAFRPIEEAIITRGGVSVKEVDARTMASKRCEGLYFAGEILDLDGYTGGFNLQIAFSTAYSAGIAMADNF